MIDYDDIRINDLPSDMRIIATDVGMDVVHILYKNCPGVTLEIPYGYNLTNSSIRLLQSKCGEEITKRIVENCGGINITIPKILPRFYIIRHINKNFTGENAKELAIELNIAERTFYYILEEMANLVDDCKAIDKNDLFKDLI